MRTSPDSPEPPPPVANLRPKEKVERLLELARGKKRALILTHDNPDPDSLAAAVGLTYLLEEKAGLQAKVGYGGIIGRAENIAFVRLLKLPVTHVSQLSPEEFDLWGVVDTQPSVGNHSLPARFQPHIVVDHHPLRDESLRAPFADVGGDYGATSTMVGEYLRAAKVELGPELATALFYGIKADTQDLGRETTAIDVDCYLWLFPRIDKRLLGQIEHPDLPARYFHLFHKAIEKARVYGSAVVTDLGEVYSPDLVADVAERMMYLEGQKWSLAVGSYRSQLYFSVRTRDRRMNAGRLMREVCQDRGGSAGGHGSMAGARVPLWGTRAQRAAVKRELLKEFLGRLGVATEKPVPLLTLGES
jgi:nanoRNase/pAp phosphatase (c-di-AMP/oligoRNAs hydrolase)